MNGRRRGIYGGAFDPPHLGHLVLADRARHELGLDEVVFVPCASQPLKGTCTAAGPQRLELTQLLVADRPEFCVSDVELSRGGVSYTVDTVAWFREQDPHAQLWLLLGGDALADFPRWRSPRQIAEVARLGVADRPGSTLERLLPDLPAWLQPRVDRFAMPLLNVASRDLRADLAAGRSTRYLIPDLVLARIGKLHLYGSA